jgi:hypothetical protein
MSQSPQRENPFPGMNPFMEDYWENVHVVLLGEVQADLSDELPDDLLARAEERVEMIESPGPGLSDDWTRQEYRADVAVSER